MAEPRGFSDGEFEMRYRRLVLECPQCGRAKLVERQRHDPPAAARLGAPCDRCPGEDNGLVEYFDAGGNQLFLDGDGDGDG